MKRIIGIILIISMLLSVFSAGFITSADYESSSFVYATMTFSEYEVDPGDEVEMTISITPYDDIEVGCIQFYVSYFGMSYPFIFEDSGADLPEAFDTAMVAQSEFNVPIKYIWDSTDNISLKANEVTELGTFTLKVHEQAILGEYQFNVHFDVLSSFSLEAGEFIDIPVLESDYIDLFVGEKLTAYGSLFEVPVGGAEDYAYDIFTNKILDHEHTYIENTDVAEIVELVDSEDYTTIRIRGKLLGENTVLHIKSADEELDEFLDIVIKVVKPQPWIVTNKTLPNKTVYYIGENCDKQTLLDGLSVRVDYENYDVKTFDSVDDFTLGEYDFSTPGQKTVKVHCGDTYTIVRYTVKATPEYIGSNVYSASAGAIWNVPEETSVEDFIGNTNVSDRIKIYDASGNPVTEGIITTGMKAEFVLENEVKASALISVKYDADCDGKVSIKDLMLCKKAALGEGALSSAQVKAIGGAANAQALVLMKNYILQ